jgi:hypothetical protein
MSETRKEKPNSFFYVIGFQSSGTTLLSYLLDKHPDILCVTEPSVSKRIALKQSSVLEYTSHRTITRALDFYNVDPEQYTKLVEKYLGGTLDEDSFLKESYMLLNKKKATCVGVKEACDIVMYKYDFLRKLINYHRGSIKSIFIERDIKGVVNSFIKKGYFPPGRNKLSQYNFKRFARKYIKCINYIDEHLSGNNIYCLKYEDLMQNPQKELHEIFSIFDVDSSQEYIDKILNTPGDGIALKYTGIIKERSFGWKKNISRENVVWLDELYLRKRKFISIHKPVANI